MKMPKVSLLEWQKRFETEKACIEKKRGRLKLSLSNFGFLIENEKITMYLTGNCLYIF